MIPNATRSAEALVGLRLVIAALLFVHGLFRVASGGVGGFGDFLEANHLPAGHLLAWTVTIMELVGTVVLAAGRLVRPLALYFAAELAVGIALVHSHSGWFVVGGGRNGMEYSVALIAILLAQAWAAGPKSAPPPPPVP